MHRAVPGIKDSPFPQMPIMPFILREQHLLKGFQKEWGRKCRISLHCDRSVCLKLPEAPLQLIPVQRMPFLLALICTMHSFPLDLEVASPPTVLKVLALSKLGGIFLLISICFLSWVDFFRLCKKKVRSKGLDTTMFLHALLQGTYPSGHLFVKFSFDQRETR